MTRKHYLAIAVAGALHCPLSVSAADVTISKSVGANYVFSDAELGDGEKRESNSVSITPVVGLDLKGATVNARASVSYEYVDRKVTSDDPDSINLDDSEGFTDYDYGLNWSTRNKAIGINLAGRQAYQNIDLSNALVNDRYTDLDDLAQTTANSARINLAIPNPIYFGLNASANYAKAKTDRSSDEDGVSGFDDENRTVSGTFYSGKRIRGVRWNVTGRQETTTRGERGDLTSDSIFGSFYVGLYKDLSLVARGTYQTNDVSDDQQLSDQLDFESYGAGLSWTGSLGRRVEVTYNQSEEQTGENQNYVGVDLAWPFSSRTSIAANIGRSYYGQTKAFSFAHSARRWKARIGYNESLRTFARSFLTEQNLGTIVCPIDQPDFSQCFLPDTLDYQLQAGEEYRDFTILVPEITQDITLNKRLNANLSYSYRRLKLSLTVTDGDIEYLETGLTRDELSINFNASMKVGTRTNLSWNSRVVELDREDQNIQDDTETHGLTIGYKVNQEVSTRLGITHTKRDSPEEARSYEDSRVSASLTWKF